MSAAIVDTSLSWAEIDHEDHRSVCFTGCPVCDSHRAWGTCARCGADDVEARDDGTSSCCGVRLVGPDVFGEDWAMESALA
jgi:hypothetical protein